MIIHKTEKLMRGIRIKIFPDEKQKQEIKKNIDVSRAVYNLALEIQKSNYDSGGKFIPYFDMINKFTQLKKLPEYWWMNTVSAGTVQSSLRNLDNAYNLFFKNASKYPKFKSKKNYHQSVSMRSDRTRAHGEYFKVSGISGRIFANNHIIGDDEKLYDIVISTDGHDNYFLSFSREIDIEVEDHTSDIIGIDVGIRNMMTTSDGSYYHFSDTKRLERISARRKRRVSKYQRKYLDISNHTRTKYDEVPKSKNYEKALIYSTKTAKKIVNKRRNDIHQATRSIINKNPSAIVIEDISVNEIINNKNWMRKYAPQMMFYEMHKQLRYKAEAKGIEVIVADRDFPSSQICSNCGFKHKIYGNHTFSCPICGFHEDRDLNAALNLRNYALQK